MRIPIFFVVLLLPVCALAQEGVVQPLGFVPVNGFPNWEERVLHQWINRARVEPSIDLAGCGANCSPAEILSSCYTAVPPLYWDLELARAARFHSASMASQGFFGHYTTCALRPDIDDLYPDSCDGSEACACSNPDGQTSPGGRASLFGASYSGEIIAAGYSNPDAAFWGWLHEAVSSTAPCAYSSYGSGDTNGHRWLILKSSGSLGSGYAEGGAWGRYYTTDFGGGGVPTRVPSGVHYPRQGSTIELWANWYDTDDTPADARVVIGAVSYAMTLERGTANNGAWRAIVSGLTSGCHRYYFQFTGGDGVVERHPTTGTFGIGDPLTCADWAGEAIPPPTLVATAGSTSSVSVSWSAVSGASQYQLERSTGGVGFAPLATVGSTSYPDLAVSSTRTYVYRVRAVGGAWSNVDHATTIVFEDEPLAAGVTIRAVHLTQLRTAVNAVRDAAGLGAASWTHAPPVTIRAVDVAELRTALTPALTALGKSAGYTRTIAAGLTPHASDLQEIRVGTK